MRKLLDLKAIGYGLVAFVVGHLLISLLGQNILAPLFSKPSQIVAIVGDVIFIAPGVIAGFVSARKARSHHILNGSIGGVLVVFLLMVFFSSFINNILGWGPAFLILSVHVVAAVIGAVIGNYWRGKHDHKTHGHAYKP